MDIKYYVKALLAIVVSTCLLLLSSSLIASLAAARSTRISMIIIILFWLLGACVSGLIAGLIAGKNGGYLGVLASLSVALMATGEFAQEISWLLRGAISASIVLIAYFSGVLGERVARNRGVRFL